MYLPPRDNLCKDYQYQKTASATAAQLASLAEADGGIVQSINVTCADVPVIVSGRRPLQQGITQPKVTIAIVFIMPAKGSTSYQDLAGRSKSILIEQATAVSQACQ
jgi:hypothetical protein